MLLLLPVHVVLLELIIDPTCSIVLERQPAESDIMERKPRNPKESILTTSVLVKSIIQGMILFVASFASYYLYLKANPEQAEVARSIGLAIIMLSNVLLVQVNSSESEFAYKSLINLKKDHVMWAVGIGTLIGLGVILYTPIAEFLSLAPLNLNQIFRVVVTSVAAVMWYEIVKLFKKIRKGRIK